MDPISYQQGTRPRHQLHVVHVVHQLHVVHVVHKLHVVQAA